LWLEQNTDDAPHGKHRGCGLCGASAHRSKRDPANAADTRIDKVAPASQRPGLGAVREPADSLRRKGDETVAAF